MSQYYKLAAYLADLDPDSDPTQENVDRAFEILADKYGLDDPIQFDRLFNVLIPLIDVGVGAYTRKRYKGFALDGVWLADKRID